MAFLWVFAVFALLGASVHPTDGSPAVFSGIEQNIKPPTELILKHGYPAEGGRFAMTSDGHRLRLDRIPNPGKPAALLVSPLLSNTALYCFLEKGSLAFMLYDAGYDVWLGNLRTNGLSDHVSLSTSDRRFWNNTLHEHGVLDVPTLVDAVLAETGESSLTFVGHSLSSTAMLIAGAERPELASRIAAAFLMGPVAHLAHHTCPAITAWSVIRGPAEWYQQTFGPGPMPLIGWASMRHLDELSCHEWAGVPADKPNEHCETNQAFVNFFFGHGNTVHPAHFSEHMPSPAGVLAILHYAQLADPDQPGFRRFDYGKKKNRLAYGEDVPPEYDLAAIKFPVYLYTGITDPLTTPKDLATLTSSLRTLKKAYEVPEDLFGHLDFMLNPAASHALYPVIIADMNAAVGDKPVPRPDRH